MFRKIKAKFTSKKEVKTYDNIKDSILRDNIMQADDIEEIIAETRMNIKPATWYRAYLTLYVNPQININTLGKHVGVSWITAKKIRETIERKMEEKSLVW